MNKLSVKSLTCYILICLLAYSFIGNFSQIFASEPSSTNYQLRGYSFGAGGTNNNTSSSYGVNGVAGEVELGRPSSSNYQAGNGLTYLLITNLPGAPTLSLPGNNYDRMKVVLNTSGNPTDTTYAIQVSTTSNFSSNISYVKSDNTLGPTLTNSDIKTNSSWGATGFFVTGLTQNTTYYVRAKAIQGNYTEGTYGPSANITTYSSSLTFSLDSNTINFANLNANNSYTDASQTTTLTTSTNAYSGYIVYGQVDQPLTFGSNTIANYTSPNSSPTTWSGLGFGYNTSDTSLTGGTANRFSGSKYAGFTTTSPGDPVADNPGPVTATPISNEAYTISYRITGSNITPAGTYGNTILYTITPTY
jgi:hypothetical protein